jgi:hypothetical protein
MILFFSSDSLHFLATHSVKVFFAMQKGKVSIFVVPWPLFFLVLIFFLFLDYNFKKYIILIYF